MGGGGGGVLGSCSFVEERYVQIYSTYANVVRHMRSVSMTLCCQYKYYYYFLYCMSHVVCLFYYNGIRLDLILSVYINLLQNHYIGATMKTRLYDVVSV